jgi:hypothetical protein
VVAKGGSAVPIGFILIAVLGVALALVGIAMVLRVNASRQRNFYLELMTAGILICGAALFTGSISTQSTATIQASVQRRVDAARLAADESMYANYNDALVDFNNAADQMTAYGSRMQHQLNLVQLQVQNIGSSTIAGHVYTTLPTATAAQVALFKKRKMYQHLKTIEGDIQYMYQRITENVGNDDSRTLSSIANRNYAAHRLYHVLRHPVMNPVAQQTQFTDENARMQDIHR